MMIFSPRGVLRIARRMWRSMSKRSFSTIGLLNLAPTGTFHFLLGLPGLSASAEVAAVAVPVAGAASATDAPRAGTSSAAPRPQVARTATNLERTSTTPTWHLRHPNQDFPRKRGG